MAETVVLTERVQSALLKKVNSLRVKSTDGSVVSIYSGVVGSDEGDVVMEVTSTLNVDITSSGANGLDTGSPADNTWYYLFLIFNPTTNTVAGLLSTSQSSPTMPSGYTKKRWIGATRRTTALLAFTQWNEEIHYAGYIGVLSNGSSTSRVQISCSNYVPDEYAEAFQVFANATSSSFHGTGNAQIECESGSGYMLMYASYDNVATPMSFMERGTQSAWMPNYYSTARIYYYVSDSEVDCDALIQAFRLRL